jgi:hypothetical protein
MNNNETLKQIEQTLPTPEHSSKTASTLSSDDIESLFNTRLSSLESIRPYVCLRFFDTVAEKLAVEKNTLLEILNFKESQHKMLEKYSFVLSPQYFEQKFINK